jgi:hypothetical protein
LPPTNPPKETKAQQKAREEKEHEFAEMQATIRSLDQRMKLVEIENAALKRTVNALQHVADV